MMYADDILNKNRDSKPTTLTDITKGTLTGAAIGIVGGVLFAYFREQGYIKCMFIGGLIGGAVSRAFLI